MEALSGVTEDLTRDAESIAKRLATLPFEAQVAALNAVRAILHDASPFRDEPVDLVLWLATDKVRANNYNPNAVAPPEMKLQMLAKGEEKYRKALEWLENCQRTDNWPGYDDGIQLLNLPKWA